MSTLSPTEILNMLPEEARPWAVGLFIVASLVFFWLKWTDTIPQGSLGIRTSGGAIKLRYDRRRYTKDEIARQKAIDRPLVRRGQPAVYGRPKVWQPGLHLLVMIYHKYDKIVAQDQPFDIDDIVVTKENGYRGVRFSQAKVYIHAKSDKDVYLMRTATSDLPAALRAIVNTELSRLMQLRGYDAVVTVDEVLRDEIASELQLAAQARFDQLGVEFAGLDLGPATEVTELATGRALSALGESVGLERLAG